MHRQLEVDTDVLHCPLQGSLLAHLDFIRPISEYLSGNSIHWQHLLNLKKKRFKIKKNRKKRHLSHVIHDIWLVTCDMSHTVGGWRFSQNFSSLALPVWEYRRFEHVISTYISSCSEICNSFLAWYIKKISTGLRQLYLILCNIFSETKLAINTY